MSVEPALQLVGVGKTFAGPDGDVPALADVSLEVKRGEFVAVLGPSGSGKTTLLLCAGALMEPDRGRVMLAGVEPYAVSSGRRAGLRAEKVGFVFQQFHLVPYLTVLENVLAPSLGSSAAEKQRRGPDRARELIERFGLAERARHVPAELSVGECQRAALARALFNEPEVLLADEPTGNLDPDNAATVLSALRGFAAGGGAVLLVTHDREAAGSADRTLRLEAGRLAG